jgi:hypothetical protein
MFGRGQCLDPNPEKTLGEYLRKIRRSHTSAPFSEIYGISNNSVSLKVKSDS